MKTLEDLKIFYETTLLPELTVLEKQRIEVRNKILLVIAFVIPIVMYLLFGVGGDNGVMFSMLIAGSAVFGVYIFATQEYKKNFKKEIIRQIVEFIDKNLSYSKNSYISRSDFISSKIFLNNPDEYEGDDYVQGKIGQTSLKFSEIHAKYVTRNSKGERNYITIFKGLFFVADFNKSFTGKTVVLPDAAEKLFGQFGSMLQSLNKQRGQLIKLEDPEFEKMFVVYGDDQIEARYILSTSLMKRIVDFKKKTKKTIYLSFVWTKVYVGISYVRNLFEPRIFRTLLDFTPIKGYFEDLQMAVGIVEDLNLNMRIWTKQ